MLTPLSVWQQSHQFHHRHTGMHRNAHIGSYPIWTLGKWRRSTFSERLAYRWQRHPGNALLGVVTVFGLNMVLRPFLARQSQHADAAAALLLHVLLFFLAISTGNTTYGVVLCYIHFHWHPSLELYYFISSTISLKYFTSTQKLLMRNQYI